MSLKRLLYAATVPTQKARLNAFSSKESGAWLGTLLLLVSFLMMRHSEYLLGYASVHLYIFDTTVNVVLEWMNQEFMVWDATAC